MHGGVYFGGQFVGLIWLRLFIITIDVVLIAHYRASKQYKSRPQLQALRCAVLIRSREGEWAGGVGAVRTISSQTQGAFFGRSQNQNKKRKPVGTFDANHTMRSEAEVVVAPDGQTRAVEHDFLEQQTNGDGDTITFQHAPPMCPARFGRRFAVAAAADAMAPAFGFSVHTKVEVHGRQPKQKKQQLIGAIVSEQVRQAKRTRNPTWSFISGGFWYERTVKLVEVKTQIPSVRSYDRE